MTLFLLVRHGEHDNYGEGLLGRRSPLGLNDAGRAQTAALLPFLKPWTPVAIRSSPQPRARDTAAVLADGLGLSVQDEPAFDEIDYGDWTGRSFEALASDSQWRAYNSFRSGAAIPGGDLMVEIQARAIRGLVALRDAYPDAAIIIVSHLETIRAMLGYFLGAPVDFANRLGIEPASLNILRLETANARIEAINLRGHHG